MRARVVSEPRPISQCPLALVERPVQNRARRGARPGPLTFDAGATGDEVNAILATLDSDPRRRAGWPQQTDWATTPQTTSTCP